MPGYAGSGAAVEHGFRDVAACLSEHPVGRAGIDGEQACDFHDCELLNLGEYEDLAHVFVQLVECPVELAQHLAMLNGLESSKGTWIGHGVGFLHGAIGQSLAFGRASMILCNTDYDLKEPRAHARPDKL